MGERCVIKEWNGACPVVSCVRVKRKESTELMSFKSSLPCLPRSPP